MICMECIQRGMQSIVKPELHSDPRCENIISYLRVFDVPRSTLEEPKATRVTRNIRYDILDPEFLEFMAKIADYGAKKYGDFNWQTSKLEGDKSSINHIYKHLKSYRCGEPYDHAELGIEKSWHLAAIAFNAMMEFYWARREEYENRIKSIGLGTRKEKGENSKT